MNSIRAASHTPRDFWSSLDVLQRLMPRREPRKWLASLTLAMLLAACSQDPAAPENSASAEVDSRLDASPTAPQPDSARESASSQPSATAPTASSSQSRYLDLPHFGRYAFLAESDSDISLQVVDRMAGPLPVGTQRRDHLLEAGPIKVVLRGAGDFSSVALRVQPYQELHAEPYPQLVPVQWLETTLSDLQQRSYWIDVQQSRWLSLEVAGRYLDDMRLWRDGEWLSDATPQARRIEGETGQPLQSRWIHTRLEAGLYRLVIYGGPGEPWAQESPAAPLYLRKGIPEIPAYGWWQHQTSPFGVDRWRIDSEANRFQLKLDESAPAQLSIDAYADGQNPFQPGRGVQGSLDKDTRVPEIVLSSEVSRNQPRLLTVQAAPGQSYRLSALHHGTQYSLSHGGEHWIGVAGLRDPRDTIDATVAVIDRPPGRPGFAGPLTSQLPTVSRHRAWESRFTLQTPLEVLIQVDEGGRYAAELTDDSEAMAEFRIEPLYHPVAQGIGTQWQLGGRAPWELNPGLYRLHLRPAAGHPGIARLRLAPLQNDFDIDAAPDEGDEPTAATSPIAATETPAELNVQTGGRDLATLSMVAAARNRFAIVNDFDNGGGGLVIRTAPLTLDQALPVSQQADSVRSFPVLSRARAFLAAHGADGQPLPIARSADGPWEQQLYFAGAQRLQVFVRNEQSVPVSFNLHWWPEPGIHEHQQLPQVDPARLAQLQAAPLPVLGDGEEHRLQLNRQSQQSFLLDVSEPALYRFESTGLLDTAAEMRSRAVLNLASANGGGSGRNALIQHYLGQGRYRVLVRSEGRSAGPLSVRLSTAPVVERGLAPADTPLRANLLPGQAIRYQLQIEKAAEYRIHAAGLHGDFRIHLDGPDGWPLIAPGSPSPLTLRLHPGEHSLMLMPKAVEARALTTVTTVLPRPGISQGHGPHQLVLNQPHQHLWREPEAQQERVPDQWHFELSAAMNVRIELDAAMRAELHAMTDSSATRSVSGSSELSLSPGAYRLDVRAARPDDRREYRLAVNTAELLPGQQRRVELPATIPISLADDTLVRLSSVAYVDVQARLLDEQGRELAFSDSRPDDWNFLISRDLSQGRYQLQVSAADGSRGNALIDFSTPEQIKAGSLAIGEDVRIQGAQIHELSLNLPGKAASQGTPLVFTSRSLGSHGVSLERHDGQRWQVLDSQTGRSTRGGLVLDSGNLSAPHRLRVWPVDEVPQAIDVSLRSAPSGMSPSRADDRGSLTLQALPGSDAALAVTRLSAAALARSELRQGLQWAGPGGVFQRAEDGWIPTSDQLLWLLTDAEQKQVSVSVQTLQRDQAVSVPVAGPVVLRSDDSATQASALRLWVATATQQAAALLPDSEQGSGWAMADRSALALALPDSEVAALRLQRSEAGQGSVAVNVVEHALEIEDHGALSAQGRQLLLPPRSAVRMRLDDRDGQSLRIAAPAQLAVAVGQQGQLKRIYWSGERARSLHGPAQGNTLWLANAGDSPASVSVGYLEPSPHVALQPDTLLRHRAGFVGDYSIDIEPWEGEGSLMFAGAVDSARLVDTQGRVTYSRQGQIEADVSEGGTLQIRHGAGLFAIWQRSEAVSAFDWQEIASLYSAEPALWSLRALDSGLLRIDSETGATSEHWLDAEHPLDLLLPSGHYQLQRDPGMSAPTRTLTLPLAMPEGLGPQVRLAPDASTAFSFELDRPRAIGVGVRAEREVLQVRLVDAFGETLGQGITQMHPQLPAGRYFLIVHLPAEHPPVQLRPALVGSLAPDDLVPEDIQLRLSRLEGLQ